MVTVRLFAAARAAAGVDQTEVPSGSLAEILTGLAQAFPGLPAVLPRCSFLVDGIAVHGDHSSVTVVDGSQVDVLPPFAGG
jgi:molybdopterin converting factor small subunit